MFVVVAAVAVIGGVYLALGTRPDPVEFTDVRAQTAEFMAYYDSIELTAAQKRVFHEALTALPAPCCNDQTAATCCCTCNMARTWWGLSKHLIADRDYDAIETRAAVAEWFTFINPGGFSGSSCYSGGCQRPFRADGCGGMVPAKLVL
jgi:hypothetical protein